LDDKGENSRTMKRKGRGHAGCGTRKKRNAKIKRRRCGILGLSGVGFFFFVYAGRGPNFFKNQNPPHAVLSVLDL
jgi:hypothetical protein